MSASNTVRFAAEFDDTKLVQGLNGVKSAFQETGASLNQAFSDSSALQEWDNQMAQLEQEANTLEQSIQSLEQTNQSLEQANTGVSGSFDEMANSTVSLGNSLGTLESSGQTVEQQLAAIGTTSTTAGQSIQALGAEVDTTGTSMGALASNFETTTGTSDTLMQSLKDSTTQFKGLGAEAKDTGSSLKDIFSKGGSITVGISAAVSGIANLVRGFRDYGDAQIKVRSAQLTLTKATQAVATAQTAYNTAVKEYGPESSSAQEALDKLNNLTEKQAIQQDKLDKATRKAGDSIFDIWVGLGASITGIGGSIIQSLDAIGGEKGLAGLKGKFGTFATTAKSGLAEVGLAFAAMGRIAAPVAAVTAAVLGIAIAFQQAGADIKLASGDIQTKLKGMQDFFNGWKDIPIIGPILKAIIEPLGLLPQITVKAVDSNDKLNKSLNSTVPASQKSAKAQEDAANATDDYNKAVTELSVAEGIGERNSINAAKAKVATKKAIMDEKNAIAESNTTVLAHNGMWIDLTTTMAKAPPIITQVTEKTVAGTKVFQDRGNEMLKAAQAQYGYDQQVANSIKLTTGYTPILVKLGDQFQTNTEMYAQAGDAIIKVGKDYIDLGNATKFNSLSQADQNKTIEMAIKLNNEHAQAIENNSQKYDDITKEGHEWDDTLAILNSVTGQHIMKTDADAESLKGLAGALKGSRTEFKKQEEAMGVVLDKHGLLTTAIEQKILNEKDDTAEIKKLIIEHVNWADALTNVDTQTKNMLTGQEQAVEALEKYINETQIATAKTEAMEKGYVKIGQSIAKDFTGGLKLTVPQLAELGKHMGTAEQQAQAFSDIIQSKLQPAMSKLSSAIDATNIKDFNEAFDKIDFGKISGDMENFARDVSFGFQQIADKQDQMENLFAVVTLGLDRMTQSQASEWMGKIEQKFNAIAKIDPSRFTGEVKNIVASFDQLSKVDIDKHANSIQYLINNLKSWDSGKAEIFLSLWKADNLNPATTSTTGLGNALGGTGDKAGVAAPKLDQVAAALNSVNLAAEDVAKKTSTLNFEFAPPKLDQVAQAFTDVGNAGQQTAAKIQALKYIFPAPNLSQFASAINSALKAAQQVAAKITALRPVLTITANNSQAIKAINQVISASSKIRNITQTITTVYRTVGSPGGGGVRSGRFNNPVGIRAHNITGGGEIPIAALTGGGGSSAVNTSSIVGGGGSGNINITILNRDEFGTEKIRKFKAVMGKDRYVFGSVGAGG